MKYLDIGDLDDVNNALNFTTNDIQVTGGCDIYTIKPAGSERRLMKSLNLGLEARYDDDVRFAKSLSPPDAAFYESQMQNKSPFGSLGERKNRLLFAYLVLTMNASHLDYQFDDLVRPVDFKKRVLKFVTANVDETFQNFRRSHPTSTCLANLVAGGIPSTPSGTKIWSPKMWKLIDREMAFSECDVFAYEPENYDPLQAEEPAIWSMHYFFYNKDKKRVCYLYLRGLSLASQSPSQRTSAPTATQKRPRPISRSLSFSSLGAQKRAKYWLGDKFANNAMTHSWQEKRYPGDDEVDVDDALGASDGSDWLFDPESESEAEDNDELERRYRAKGIVRAMSEDLVETMEV